MYHYLVEIMACNVYINQRTRASVELAAKEYEPLKTTKVKHDIMFSIIENAVLRGYIVNELDEASITIYEQIKQLDGGKASDQAAADQKSARYRERTDFLSFLGFSFHT